jgi:hypothetical protein
VNSHPSAVVRLVPLDITTRQVLHWNVPEYPTAQWKIQQFRIGLPLDARYRLVVQDRDRIFAPVVDGVAYRERQPWAEF